MEIKGQTLAPSKFAGGNFQRSSLAEGTVPWLAWWHTKESQSKALYLPVTQNHPTDTGEEKATNSTGLGSSKCFETLLKDLERGRTLH